MKLGYIESLTKCPIHERYEDKGICFVVDVNGNEAVVCGRVCPECELPKKVFDFDVLRTL